MIISGSATAATAGRPTHILLVPGQLLVIFCIRDRNWLRLVEAPFGEQWLLGGRRVAEPQVAGLLGHDGALLVGGEAGHKAGGEAAHLAGVQVAHLLGDVHHRGHHLQVQSVEKI